MGERLGAPLLDLGGLPDAVPEVVQLRPAHGAAGDRLDLGDDRRVHRERALDADAVADLAHGERLANAGALAADHHALEELDSLLVALHDTHVHLQGVAGREGRDVVADALGIDEIGGVHGACAPGPRSGEVAGYAIPNSCSNSAASSSVRPPRAAMRSGRAWTVLAIDCARRHRATLPWSPDTSTSGTDQPRNSPGRVYCGYSRRPSVNDSSPADASLPMTPG